jgi:hypothetical protein
MIDLKKFAEDTYKAAQSPRFWLRSADNLRDGAEAILAKESEYELPYVQAHSNAIRMAAEIAASDGNEFGIQEIKARVPNYPVAQLLYAYARENLLKGIIIAKNPDVINGTRLNGQLKSHDLESLSDRAGFHLHPQEIPIAQALSKLSTWAARYPVALYGEEHKKVPNPHDLLDYGSQHVVMRSLFKRCHAALEELVPISSKNEYDSIVVFRQPGT